MKKKNNEREEGRKEGRGREKEWIINCDRMTGTELMK